MEEDARPPRTGFGAWAGFFFKNSSVKKFCGLGAEAGSFCPHPKSVRRWMHGTRKDSGVRDDKAEAGVN